MKIESTEIKLNVFIGQIGCYPITALSISLSRDTKSLAIILSSAHHRILHGDRDVVFARDDSDADGAHAVHLESELTRSGDDRLGSRLPLPLLQLSVVQSV